MGIECTEYARASSPANMLFAFMSMILKLLTPPQQASNLPIILDEYDFIIVGGGSAGCVMANRLSEVPSWQVLLLEASVEEPVLGRIPSLKPFLMAPNLSWNYKTVPQSEACGGKACNYPTAKMLGGCSAHNMMNYNCGNIRNFDVWSDIGNKGWAYRDILPYFNKSEDNRDPDIANDREHHRLGGYLTVQRLPNMDANTAVIINPFEELHFPFVDSNGGRQDGYSLVQTSCNGEGMSTN
jgi:choline dehydrogenase-like flavoprotein